MGVACPVSPILGQSLRSFGLVMISAVASWKVTLSTYCFAYLRLVDRCTTRIEGVEKWSGQFRCRFGFSVKRKSVTAELRLVLSPTN